jgi:glycosyltransferase involved in cell wall biosynthesis
LWTARQSSSLGEESVMPGGDGKQGGRLESHTVIVMTRSNWFEPPRIRHQVARQMARFTRVVFVETPGDWRRLSATTVEVVAPNIVRCSLGNPCRIPRRLQFYIDPFRTLLNRHFLRELFDVAAEHLGNRPVLVNFNYDFVEAMLSDRFATAIYYCNDEFTTWAPGAFARRFIERRERATAMAADCCLTVSTPLAAKIARWNPRTQMMLPGHDFTERRPTPRRAGPIRVAFMGYLDARIHYDWLKAVAQDPDMEVHLIGPVVRETDAIRELLALPSVTAYGPRVGAELQELLLDADVLTLPYLGTPSSGMLAVTAPNKLFTYLAVGKPIVTSNLPALVSMDDGLLYRAASLGEFVTVVRRAFNEDNDALREKRLAIARENTWDARGDELRVVVEGALARRTRQHDYERDRGE